MKNTLIGKPFWILFKGKIKEFPNDKENLNLEYSGKKAVIVFDPKLNLEDLNLKIESLDFKS